MRPQQDNPLGSSAAPDLLTRSLAAFYRSLPEVLKTHYGQWVAYHGDECLGFAHTETELYDRCRRRGLKEDEFIVYYADRQALHDHEEIELPPNP